MKRTMVFLAVALLSGASLVHCGSESSRCTGAEHCACYGNGTCNAGLDCRSQLCVNLNGTASGGEANSGDLNVDACLACGENTCTKESKDCKAASGCEAIIQCMIRCGKDAVCISKCNASSSADANARSLSYQACAFTRCADQCLLSGGTGAGGNAGTGAGGASSTGGNAGQSSSAGAGGSPGGRSGNGGATSTGGSAAVELTSGVNWLGLSAEAAPPTLGPNGKLGIDGVFYTYGDGCATISWDALTRCISGELCLASATNWGVSIGFDLRNTGESGTPPDTKLAWDATSASASGFAWETRSPSGTSFQFWVQNMDPMWNGRCSAAECSINGPPDGTSSASAKGQLSFGQMVKDDWGATGTAYVFSAAAISALQFKIPAAASSLSTSYSLCIDRLGVIR
jgi:hypothetical protein